MGTQQDWDEQASALYRVLAEIAVPGRAQQLAALLCLMPFGAQERFRIVDLGCGEGMFAYAALTAFPNATVLALDGSASMRAHAAELLRPFPERAVVESVALDAADWHGALDDADCVVSSLVVHHLTADGKRMLFDEAFRRMSARGALLLADLVMPQRSEARRLYADSYDIISRQQSIEYTGDDALYQRLVDEQWNYYRFSDDDAEMPSPLPHQLRWLADAGFADVDCFWMQAGHAVYGGYKTPEVAQAIAHSASLSLQDALAAVAAATQANR